MEKYFESSLFRTVEIQQTAAFTPSYFALIRKSSLHLVCVWKGSIVKNILTLLYKQTVSHCEGHDAFV